MFLERGKAEFNAVFKRINRIYLKEYQRLKLGPTSHSELAAYLDGFQCSKLTIHVSQLTF